MPRDIFCASLVSKRPTNHRWLAFSGGPDSQMVRIEDTGGRVVAGTGGGRSRRCFATRLRYCMSYDNSTRRRAAPNVAITEKKAVLGWCTTSRSNQGSSSDEALVSSMVATVTSSLVGICRQSEPKSTRDLAPRASAEGSLVTVRLKHDLACESSGAVHEKKLIHACVTASPFATLLQRQRPKLHERDVPCRYFEKSRSQVRKFSSTQLVLFLF